MSKLLEVNNISVSYHKGSQVLWDVSLEINDGECIALVGVNGAGKTTLINTICGIIHPHKGTITFEGKRIDNLEPHAIASLGLIQVPEGGGLFSKLTVKENLLMGCYLKEKRKRAAQKLKEVYSIFPWLKDRENQVAESLSGGERQMLAIARGLMANPKLLIIDEVSLGLSPLAIKEVYRKIKEIKNLGITTLIVDENARRALSICDRAYVIESGRIVLSGKPTELLENKEFEKVYFGVEG
ncbi:MAG: ABC transporter ATP-binding protein [Candidatus Bathyarchaeia archaeon]|nr:ABC transporter ATP-binding protein [Candidatus Bathyarchaeota archaeon]